MRVITRSGAPFLYVDSLQSFEILSTCTEHAGHVLFRPSPGPAQAQKCCQHGDERAAGGQSKLQFQLQGFMQLLSGKAFTPLVFPNTKKSAHLADPINYLNFSEGPLLFLCRQS